MTEIAFPKHDASHPDRGIDCEFAIEPAFQGLARNAEAAGWTEAEVAAALLMLSRNHIDGIIADDVTAAQIAAARGQAS